TRVAGSGYHPARGFAMVPPASPAGARSSPVGAEHSEFSSNKHHGSSSMSAADVRPADVVTRGSSPMGASRIDVVMELPFHLLQTLRLAQAIGESGFRICVPPDDEVKVVTLNRVFGFDYRVG